MFDVMDPVLVSAPSRVVEGGGRAEKRPDRFTDSMSPGVKRSPLSTGFQSVEPMPSVKLQASVRIAPEDSHRRGSFVVRGAQFALRA